MLFNPLTAFSENQENLDALRNQIERLQKNLIRKEKEKLDASHALQETERAISSINRKRSTLLKERNIADQKLDVLKKQHQELKNNTLIAQNRLNKLLYQQYTGGQQDQLKLLLNLQNPNQVSRDIHYYKHIATARTDAISAFHDNQEKLETLTRAMQQKKTEIETIQTRYAVQNERLKQQKLKHQTALSQISSQITQQQHAIEKLKRDEKRIANVVAEINKILKQQKPSKSLYNNELPSISQNRSAFSTLKGKLNLPVRGKLVSRFGGQRSGKHVTWKGLFISSLHGSDVKAIANGQVVFADWLRGFGNLMIIDHGNTYMSLYGNNKSLHKQVGDIIRSGDTIATVGNSGGNADSGLYFELRHQGQPFDPLTWIKIK